MTWSLYKHFGIISKHSNLARLNCFGQWVHIKEEEEEHWAPVSSPATHQMLQTECQTLLLMLSLSGNGCISKTLTTLAACRRTHNAVTSSRADHDWPCQRPWTNLNKWRRLVLLYQGVLQSGRVLLLIVLHMTSIENGLPVVVGNLPRLPVVVLHLPTQRQSG